MYVDFKIICCGVFATLALLSSEKELLTSPLSFYVVYYKIAFNTNNSIQFGDVPLVEYTIRFFFNVKASVSRERIELVEIDNSF